MPLLDSGGQPIQVLTPQEIINSITLAIYDNNVNGVNPRRVRSVLNLIVAGLSATSGTNPNGISGQNPINYDPFNAVISILKASAEQDGYLSKEDFATFAAAAGVPSDYNTFDFVKRGFGNSGAVGQAGDIYQGWISDGVYSTHAVYDGVGDLNDPASFEHKQIIEY